MSELEQALYPFPTEGIIIPPKRLKSDQYDGRFALDDIYWSETLGNYVVRNRCDKCRIKKKACSRSGTACTLCALDGAKCTWEDPSWQDLRTNKSVQPAERPSAQRRTRANVAGTSTPAPAPARIPAPASRLVSITKKVEVQPDQTRKRMLKLAPTAGSARKKPRVTELHTTTYRAPKWDVVVPKPSKVQAKSDDKHKRKLEPSRQPTLWCSTLDEFIEVMPFYADRSQDGIVTGRHAIFMTAETPVHEYDGWSEDQRVLTVSFIRRFKRDIDWLPMQTSANSARPSSTNVSPVHPICVTCSSGISSTRFEELFPGEPVRRDLDPVHDLEPPEDIASLFFVGRCGLPILIVCSDKWALKPEVLTGVAFLGWFAVEQIDEEVLDGLGKSSGTVRWRVQLSYRSSDECPPWWLDEPWPDIPPARHAAKDLLPDALLRSIKRDGTKAPRGWLCPRCGRVNARSHVHAYTCASCPDQSVPAPILDSRALRPPFAEQRTPIPDLEVSAHADAMIPPQASIFDDHSVVLKYASDDDHGVSHHLANLGMLRGERSHSLFGDIQQKGVFSLLPRDGVADLVRVSIVPDSRVKHLRPMFCFVRTPDELHDVHSTLTAILRQCEIDPVEYDERTLVGLMCIEPCKGMSIRFSETLNDVSILSLGANVILSCSTQTPKRPRFTMQMHHSDGVVLEEPGKAKYWEFKSEDAMMLLMSYKAANPPAQS